MQGCAPEAVDISSESDETKQLYGIERSGLPHPYGRQCLLARRLVERGVRFVQLISGAYVSIEDHLGRPRQYRIAITGSTPKRWTNRSPG